MRRVSAKIRLTLFTTFLMLLMASVLIGLMLSLSEEIIASNSIAQLIEVVEDNSDELEFDDRKLDTDDIDFFEKGVYTLLYSQDGEHLAGDFPLESILETPFTDKKTTEYTHDGTLYYLYDELAPVEDSRSLVWIRGIIAVDEVATATSNILQMALFSLPIFVILGAIACYFVAKSTFRPIDKIIDTAKKISDSENLALRIDIKNASPEINKLADTFDNMFERLENAFEAEKQFTSDVSHELRTPTAVILAQCEYAIGENIALQDKEDALESVQRQAFKISNIISNLLKLIRLDRGVEKLEILRINLSELVQEVCEEQIMLAPADVKLTYDIAPNINGNFDYTLISRLLENLISNSLRYKKENGDIQVTLIENATEIVLSVKDNGIGIAKEHQNKVWNRFYQVDNSRTSSQNSSVGLGLSIVAQVAKLHHAKIELESELGEGSIFTVKFPK